MGLRVLPFVADKPTLHCKTCQHGDKKQNIPPMDLVTRQMRGCGFLPKKENAQPWFEIPDVDMDRDEITVCPGFAIGLPEVNEAVYYRPSWSKGYLAEHLGDPPSSQMLDAQNVLEGAINAKQASDLKKREEEAKRGRQ